MADVRSICAEFGLDEDAARQALAAGETAAGGGNPWYVQGILGIGAWISGLVIIAFGVILMGAFLDIDDPGIPIGVLGLVFFGTGFFLLSDPEISLFKKQFAIAIGAAGIALAAGGVGVEAEEVWVATLVAVPMAAVVARMSPSLSLQSLGSALAVVLCVASLIDQKSTYFLALVSLTLVAGALLLMRPPRMDLRPTAGILLFTGPLAMALFDPEFGLVGWTEADVGGWFARAIHIALFCWLTWKIWLHMEDKAARIELVAFAATATALSLIMPPGGSAALAILALSFVLGSRLLAMGGVLLQICFLVQFYYQLETSLLVKSMILSATGLVLLALWAVVRRVTAKQAVR